MGNVEKASKKAVLPLHFRISTSVTSNSKKTYRMPEGDIYIDVSDCQGWHKAGLKERKRRHPEHQRGCEAGCGAQPVFGRCDLNDDNDFSDTDEQFYYLHNTQYSVHAIIDTSGSIIEVYKNYQPYGAVDVYTGDGGDSDWFDGDETTGSLSSNYYLFTGKRYDPEADLMFYRNRMYSTSRGRFLQRDPIGYVDGLNLYEIYYVIISLDPSGLKSFESEPPKPSSDQSSSNPNKPGSLDPSNSRSKIKDRWGYVSNVTGWPWWGVDADDLIKCVKRCPPENDSQSSEQSQNHEQNTENKRCFWKICGELKLRENVDIVIAKKFMYKGVFYDIKGKHEQNIRKNEKRHIKELKAGLADINKTKPTEEYKTKGECLIERRKFLGPINYRKWQKNVKDTAKHKGWSKSMKELSVREAYNLLK